MVFKENLTFSNELRVLRCVCFYYSCFSLFHYIEAVYSLKYLTNRYEADLNQKNFICFNIKKN